MKRELKGPSGKPLSRKSRHHDILEDPDVYRWYRAMQARSLSSANVYRNHLARFCKDIGMSPREYAALTEKEHADILQDFILDEGAKGCRGSYLEKYVTGVRSWLRHNGKLLIRRISIPRRPDEDAPIRIPTPQELRAVRNDLDPMFKIRLDLMALSGQRPEVMGMYGGVDGLKLGDIPDLILAKGKAR